MDNRKRYISKKDFGEDRTNVGYALYVRENLKPKDYFRCNTGDIYQSMTVSPIPNGKVYYANGDYTWVDELAIRNFSPNLLDLVEPNDVVVVESIKYTVLQSEDQFNNKLYIERGTDCRTTRRTALEKLFENNEIQEILTHEQFRLNSYKVGK